MDASGAARHATAGRIEAASALLAGVLLGATVGVIGTIFHRTAWGRLPVGVVAGLVLVGAGVVFMRALGGRIPTACFVGATLLGLAALAWLTPGVDRILLPDAAGLAWGVGAAATGVAGLALPERWFAD